MKIDKNNSQDLLKKYYEGNTSLEEERALRAFLGSKQGREADKTTAELFHMFEAMEAEDAPSGNLHVGENNLPEEAFVPEESQKMRKLHFSWVSGIAAGFVMLVIGFALGLLIDKNGTASDEKLAALQNDMDEMKAMMALTDLHKDSPSERIKATYEVRAIQKPDEKVLNALINTLKTDPNVNVKVAAAEALFTFGNNDSVRLAFIDALSREQEPLLKIKLIDMLVRLGEKRALPELQQVVNDEYQMKVVRDRAAQGISKLL